MSEEADSLPPVDPAKKQTFLMIVQTAIAAACAGNPGSASHAMGRALRASDRIPIELSATTAAEDFVLFAFDPPDGEFAPKWMKILTPAEFATRRGVTKELVDGVWRPQNPRWLGLPGDDSRYLNLLAHIREEGTATFEDLSKVLPNVVPKELARLLHEAEAEAEHLVRRSTTPDGPVWEATDALFRSRPLPSVAADVARRGGYSIPPEKVVPPPIETVLKPERPKPDTLAYPDAQIIMAELRGGKQLAVRDLNKQLPHLDRTAVLRHLKRLRDADHVQLIGEGRNALWHLAPKPRKPRSPRKKPVVETLGDTSAPLPRAMPLTEEDADKVTRFVQENPGFGLVEIARRLGYDNRNQLWNLTEKLYGRRLLHRRSGRLYPGKDPDWE